MLELPPLHHTSKLSPPQMASRINLTVAVPMLSLLFTFFYMGCLSSADAQVTFSRDWKAGKRSVGPDCLGNFPSAASICHMLISELKALATCEAVTLLKHRGVDISPGQDTLDSSRSDQR